MRKSLRFEIHRISPLKYIGNNKYIGRNPFNNKKNDLIVDSLYNFIVIKSENFAGSLSDFKKLCINKKFKYKKIRAIDSLPNIKLQKKIHQIDSKIFMLVNEVMKINKNFHRIIKKSMFNKFVYDTEFDIEVSFYVSSKHSAYNKQDDNIIFQEIFCKRDILNLKIKNNSEFKDFSSKYQKEFWLFLTKELFEECSDEDFLFINKILIDIKPIVQLGKGF